MHKQPRGVILLLNPPPLWRVVRGRQGGGIAARTMTFQQTIFALLLAARGTSAILHKHLSFVPPFLDVDHFGKRTVGFEWDLTGVAKAMRNFVRLTPDQQVCTTAVLL